jgi:NAD(P)-dependent dehydrogenase (short-subunit alcohol dehydrogenase family)
MRILITGAGRAIGRATAEELIARGHDVVATARDPGLLADLAGGRVLALDVTDDASVAACLAAAGDLDAVVNNAAIIGSGPMEDYPVDQFRRVMETNVIGAMRMIQGVVPGWRERGTAGVIVNVSSVQGRVATPLEGPYAASKHALEGMSETMHYELAHFGIRVVIIEPGFIAPGMKHGDDHTGPPVYQQLWDEWSGTDATLNEGGRPGPELVARAIADAIEQPDTPLRVPVGADAEMIFATRDALGDAEFEATMRATIGLTW